MATAHSTPFPPRGDPGRHSLLLSPVTVVGATKLTDLLLVLGSAYATFVLYFGVLTDLEPGGMERYTLAPLLAGVLFRIGFRRIGGYDFRRLSLLRWQLAHGAMVWAAVVAALLLLGFIGKQSESFSRGWALSWTVSTLASLLIARAVLRLLILRWTRQGYLARNVVVVGAGEPGAQLIGKLQRSREEGVKICGVFDDRMSRIPPSVSGFEVLGTTDDLFDFVRRTAIDEVIVALPLNAETRLRQLFDKLKLLPVDLRLSAEPMAEAFPVRGLTYLADVPVLEIMERPLKNWNAITKWIEDKLLGGILLLLSLPLMAVVAALVKFDSKGPVLFVQERYGFNNNVIRVLKFRTMYSGRGDASGAARTVRGDPRVTRVGRILRALSLDEMPQLFNVVRGDMSLVGPRPHAIAMKAGGRLYPEAVSEYLARHRVKPGITGWAQTHGLRGEIDTLEKARARVAHDLYYIEHWSLSLDLWILAMTAPSLFVHRNAY
ncbi:MAG TPA: undecaprenyl-phosphate glucose phosphotransferase [Stellaceae bacterium]|nr:undecaprenyl-phosphate glucose phosphotransferase [Stellaceae bacterium]